MWPEWIWSPLRRTAALFELRTPPTATRALHIWMLIAIVAVGAGLRVWDLGEVGLHGDEKTNALPTIHIVEHGTPYMPSGMFYPRAIGQLYLMAASVQVFGESEWAMRLPSALCGVLLIVLSFFVGRRFLAPAWNLAFVAAVAFLPQFVIEAQTARMYVFMVTSIAAALVLLFGWERTGRPLWLIGAVLLLLIGLQFHTLAVFTAPLLLFPGLLRADPRKLLAGALAFAVVVGGFYLIDAWVMSHYPAPEKVEGFEPLPAGPKARWAVPEIAWWWVVPAVLAATAVAAFMVRAIPRRAALLAGGLVSAGLAAQTLFAYHAAALLLAGGLVVARRAGNLSTRRVAVLAAICGAVAVAQIAFIHAQGSGSLRQTFGALIGWPSAWPFLVVTGYSVAAAVLVGLGLLRALWCVAHRERVPDHVLFVVLGVWLPLFLIGFFSWDIPLRYAAGQALPLLLGAIATAQWLAGAGWRVLAPLRTRHAAALAAAAVCVVVVNPVLFTRTVHAGYAAHPDHKGAAEYMRSVALGPRDLIVAEDALQQTYYLGEGAVHYSLMASYDAAKFVRKVGGEARDFYVHVPVIGSGEELARLLDEPDRGALYVIGSGEEGTEGRAYFRGLGIQEVLDSPRFEVVYRGRDGVTQIWRSPPPSLAARK